jgi:hypothetical protein
MADSIIEQMKIIGPLTIPPHTVDSGPSRSPHSGVRDDGVGRSTARNLLKN